MMIVVAPTVTEDGLPAVVERVSGLVETHSGSVESVNYDSPWGRRRLAYPIQKFRDAFYVLYYFDMAPRSIDELDRDIRLDSTIIRHLIVKFDPLAEREGLAEDADDDDERDDDDARRETRAAAAPVAAEAPAETDVAPAASEDEAAADDTAAEVDQAEDAEASEEAETEDDDAEAEVAADGDDDDDTDAEEDDEDES